MPRLTKIYTRTGDDGTTGLAGGQRVRKTGVRIEAIGAVDELNAAVGLALASGPQAALVAPLRRVQNELFHLGSDLCMIESGAARPPAPRIEPRHIEGLERLMDEWSGGLSELENFILPGGTPAAAALHLARTLCRRAERAVLRLAEAEPVGAPVPVYLNRLSDALFILARVENHLAGVSEPLWDSRA